MSQQKAATEPEMLTGQLHVYVAFDWGDEIDLERARRQGAGVVLDMLRRPRTPVSIAYRPSPLRFPLGPIMVAMPGLSGTPIHSAEATVFDFAGVSVALKLPFSLTREELPLLASRLACPARTSELRISKSLHAGRVRCSAFFGVLVLPGRLSFCLSHTRDCQADESREPCITAITSTRSARTT